MKSACSEDFKTDPTFDIWPTRSWENWGKRHQGSFSVFTFLGNFKSFFCIISCKTYKNWKWPLVCSNPNISASTWPKLKIKDSFEILRTSRFQNWPSFLNLVKIWGSYCQNMKVILFLWTRCIYLTFYWKEFYLICILLNLTIPGTLHIVTFWNKKINK